jgi:hypothetical protein
MAATILRHRSRIRPVCPRQEYSCSSRHANISVDIVKPVKSKRAIGEPHPALIVKAYCYDYGYAP